MNGVIYWNGQYVPIAEFSRLLFEEGKEKKSEKGGETKSPPR